MKTKIIGSFEGSWAELTFDNGVLDGDPGPLSTIRGFQESVGPGPHFPGTADPPNLQDHRDWYLAALAVFGTQDVHIEGDRPADVQGQADVVH
jgi:hypothetical protein